MAEIAQEFLMRSAKAGVHFIVESHRRMRLTQTGIDTIQKVLRTTSVKVIRTLLNPRKQYIMEARSRRMCCVLNRTGFDYPFAHHCGGI